MKHQKLIAFSPLLTILIIPLVLGFVSDIKFLIIISLFVVIISTWSILNVRSKLKAVPIVLGALILIAVYFMYFYVKNFMKDWQF